MKLPEAIALMLEGKAMVDEYGHANRYVKRRKFGTFECHREGFWAICSALALYGWREATPDELKEIGMEPRA